MAGEWYYARENQQYGPVSWAELQAMAARGQIVPADLLWTQGAAQWSPASSIEGLFAAAPEYAVSPIEAAPAGAPLAYAYGTGILQPHGTAAANAGFWLRFAAFVIDWLVTFVGGFIIGAFIGAIIGFAMASSGHRTDIRLVAQAVGNVAGIIMTWLYFALMESSKSQATLGKMALGLRVTDLQGQRVSFGRATGRYFAKILSVLTLFIGYMMAGWTQKKQALHDMVADTLVTRTR